MDRIVQNNHRAPLADLALWAEANQSATDAGTPTAVVHGHFGISSVGAAVDLASTTSPQGMVICAAGLRGQDHGVALVVDLEGLGLSNHGCSVTNAAQTIVDQWGPALSRVLGIAETRIAWVEVDSTGSFDQLFPRFGPGAGRCTDVWFSPLMPVAARGSAPPRSPSAFLQHFPALGPVLLKRLFNVTGVSLASQAAIA